VGRGARAADNLLERARRLTTASAKGVSAYRPYCVVVVHSTSFEKATGWQVVVDV
jgi:hypothetical protein